MFRFDFEPVAFFPNHVDLNTLGQGRDDFVKVAGAFAQRDFSGGFIGTFDLLRAHLGADHHSAQRNDEGD